MFLRVSVSALLLLFGTAVAGVGQQPAATSPTPQAPFRAGVDVIRLDVSVLDRDGQPVRGLTAADFTVLEDGRVQPVVAFSAIDLPDWTASRAAWTRLVAPDVATNRFAAQRSIVILVDDFSTPTSSSEATKHVARDIVAGMGPKDIVAVVYTFNRKKGQEFTRDRTRLLAAVDRFIGLGRFPSLACLDGSMGMGGNDDCLVQALANAADILHGSTEGRKTIALVSPGLLPMTPEDVFQKNRKIERAVVAMQEANINVYQFDPRGLQTAPPDRLAPSFADMTGGRTTESNAPWTLVTQLLKENSSYYLLGVQRTNRAPDGRFHRLTVRVTRKDVEVRARSGYVAAPLKVKAPKHPIAPLDAAIAGGLPTGNVPLDLALAPFARPGKPGATLMMVTGIEPTGHLATATTVEMIATAFRDDWKSAGALRAQVQLPPVASRKDPTPFDVPVQLDLAPGRYEIRVAIDNRVTSQTGSVYTSVTVPDFAKEPLSLSGVVLERGAERTPTASRQFATTDRVTSFVRVYQGGRQPLVPIRLDLRVVDVDDHVAFAQSQVVTVEAFRERGADVRVDLSLAGLAPDLYLLAIEAHDETHAATRQVRFEVR